MPRSLARWLYFLLVFTTALPAFAETTHEGKEVRQLKLADGRVLTGLVIEATAEGMDIQVPQGLISVAYGSLAEVEVLEAESYVAQAPMRIGLAPSMFRSDRDKGIAHGVNEWLPEVVALVPGTEVVSVKQWAQALAGRGTELHSCSGQVGCLRPLAAELNLDRLLIPRLGDSDETEQDLSFTSVVVSTGTTLRPVFRRVQSHGSETKPSATGPELLDGVFEALGFRPTVDTRVLARTLFPVEDQEDVAARGPSAAPITPKVLTPVPKTPPTTIATKKLDARPILGTRTPPPRLQLSQRNTVALSFLPVPGLAAALERDRGAFVLSLVGTIALSWATVYTAGRLAHSADAFWAPSVLGSYAICVGFNQVSLAFLRGRRARSADSGSRTAPPHAAAGLAPLVSSNPGSPASPIGAKVVLSGAF